MEKTMTRNSLISLANAGLVNVTASEREREQTQSCFPALLEGEKRVGLSSTPATIGKLKRCPKTDVHPKFVVFF